MIGLLDSLFSTKLSPPRIKKPLCLTILDKTCFFYSNCHLFFPKCVKQKIITRILTKKLVIRSEDVSEEPFLGIFSKSAALN